MARLLPARNYLITRRSEQPRHLLRRSLRMKKTRLRLIVRAARLKDARLRADMYHDDEIGRVCHRQVRRTFLSWRRPARALDGAEMR